VVFMDVLPDPMVELQAVGRVHRIGQRSETTVWHIVSTGSVDVVLRQLDTYRYEVRLRTLLRGLVDSLPVDAKIDSRATREMAGGLQHVEGEEEEEEEEVAVEVLSEEEEEQDAGADNGPLAMEGSMADGHTSADKSHAAAEPDRSAEGPLPEEEGAAPADMMVTDDDVVASPSARANHASSHVPSHVHVPVVPIANTTINADAEKRQRRIERLAELKEHFEQGLLADQGTYRHLVAMAYRDEL
jgi:hypothetical protein